MRGYFAIGVWRPKTSENVGTLWRHAKLYGAAFIFTVEHRYSHQPTDTICATRHVPLLHFSSIEELKDSLDCALIGVELCAEAMPLSEFSHPERACYILGSKDRGLSLEALGCCEQVVAVPCPSSLSMNVATAGTIVMYDRFLKRSSGCSKGVSSNGKNLRS